MTTVNSHGTYLGLHWMVKEYQVRDLQTGFAQLTLQLKNELMYKNTKKKHRKGEFKAAAPRRAAIATSNLFSRCMICSSSSSLSGSPARPFQRSLFFFCFPCVSFTAGSSASTLPSVARSSKKLFFPFLSFFPFFSFLWGCHGRDLFPFPHGLFFRFFGHDGVFERPVCVFQ